MAQNSELAAMASDGLTLFRCLEEAQEGQSLAAAYGDAAKAIVMLWGTKIGFGLGARIGRGFVLAKLTPAPGAPSMQGIYRWSAPLFVKVRVAQGGLVFGCARSKSFMLSMDGCLLKELKSTGHSIMGVDTSFTMFSPSTESKSDVIALSWGESGLAGSSLVTGLLMDFSLSGGGMSVDMKRIHRLYGPDATTAAVLDGSVPAPPEMAPLYARINAMIETAHAPAPHLTRASLQRYTAGYDPDRRIITSKSARVIHRGDSDERLAGDGGAGVTAARVRTEE